VLQCVAVCCSACGRYSQISARSVLQCVAVCCSVLQCVAVRLVDILKYHRCALIMCWDAGRQGTGKYSQMSSCSVLHCVIVCCSVLQCVAIRLVDIFKCQRAVRCSVLKWVAMCCIVLQCVAVCYSVLQCVAVCCSILQCVAVRVVDILTHHRCAFIICRDAYKIATYICIYIDLYRYIFIHILI